MRPVRAVAVWLCAGLAALTAADPEERFTAPFAFVATGSGVVVSADGEILTNHHVIADACSPLAPALTVRLAASGEVAARLVATDPVGDIALLRLDPGHPPVRPATLVERLPAPGAPVVAVGNPFALGDLDDRPTVTRGVLSTGRVVRGPYPDCLQHDAAANPGNSGGPLFDAAGGLIGITGAIRSRSGFRVNSGIGLAVAAPQLLRFLPALRASPSGWVHRTAAPAGLELADGADGVTATAVPADGPLRSGDALLAVDGRACPSADTARGLFTGAPWTADATLPVRVRRGTATLELAVPVGRSRIPGRAWHGLATAEQNGALVVESVADGAPFAQTASAVQVGETVIAANGVAIAGRLDLLRVTAPLEVGDRLELRLRAADGTERTAVAWLAPEPAP